MRLGGTGPSKAGGQSSLVDALAGEFEEDGDEVANAWGQGDLMDVNADADDWSEQLLLRAAALRADHGPPRQVPLRRRQRL